LHLSTLYPYPTPLYFIFSFKAPAPTAIYTLSLHDALPISSHAARSCPHPVQDLQQPRVPALVADGDAQALRQAVAAHRPHHHARSEEHTSELQSRENLVCRLLLEKKKRTYRSA